MKYIITNFNEVNGVIEVELENSYRFSIQIPIVDNKFLEGQELDACIKENIPHWDIERKEILKNGIENANKIKQLVKSNEIKVDSTQLEKNIRFKRNSLLKETDWVLLSDSPLNEEEKQLYIRYRQELRDIPQQIEFPNNVIWPVLE